MPSSLAPAFLVSMPQLADPNFKRTVVLLCQHANQYLLANGCRDSRFANGGLFNDAS